MKVVLLHNYYQQRGGEDSVFELETELLRRFGHEVETLTFHNNTIGATQSKLKTGVQSFHNPDSVERLQETLTRFRPDVVHVHNFFPIASPAIFGAARRQGVPTVMTLHNFRLVCPNALLMRDGQVCESCIDKMLPLDGIKNRCYRNSTLQSAALAGMTAWHKLTGTWRRNVSRYIALNEFARDKILSSSLQLKAEQVTVKPNFTFDPLADGHIVPPNEREPMFLYVGRFSEEKGISTLLKSFQESGLSLSLIGGGPLEAMIREAAARNRNIQVLGYLDRAEVLERMKRARALVLPSVCYENFPMTVMEAMAAGTPAITGRIGPMPEIVEDGQTGLLFTPGSAEDLTQKAKMMMHDEALYVPMPQNARQRYLSRYTPEMNIRQLIDIYEKVQA